MTFKAYIDNIKIKTGKSPADFMALAKKKGFVKDGKVIAKHGEVLDWIKSEFAFGSWPCERDCVLSSRPGVGQEEDS